MSVESLAQAIDRFADQDPDGLAAIDAGRTWSWSELRALTASYVDAVAGPPGATDVLLLPASGAAIALMAASERAGGRAILVAPPYGEDRALAVAAALGARRVLTATGGTVRVLSEVAGEPSAAGIAPAVLVLTSGTTGTPRCALHTWATLSASVRRKDSYAQRRWLIAYPLSHFAGLQVLVQCLFNRGTLVIPSDFSAPAGMTALRDHGVAYLCSTPTYLRQLLMASAPADWLALQLEHVTLGGEIVDQHALDSLQRCRPGVAVTHTYASTELGAVLSVRDGREGFDAALLDGQRLKLRDGQLYVRRSAPAMLEYVGTDEAPTGDWVATRDLVEVHEGRALFRGRTTNVINVGGFKVNPIEVEAVIRVVTGVRDVLVVGRKSSIAGHLIKAILCADPSTDRVALQASITRLCAERLPAHMVPRLFEFRDQLELSGSQKRVRNPVGSE